MLPALPSAAAWSHVSATLKQRGALMLHRAADWHARVLGFLAVAIVACSSDGSVNVPSQSGFLEITTTTTGTEIDPDGYAVQFDAQDGGTVGSSSTMQIDVPPGDHTVQLTGLAPNCTVSGETLRSVSVEAAQTIPLTFAVTCGASTGGLQVSTGTGGGAVDADGYEIMLDGSDRGPIGASAEVTLDGLPPGEHEIGLSGVAANCQADGDNPRTVTVAAG